MVRLFASLAAAIIFFCDFLLKRWIDQSIEPMTYIYPYGGIPIFKDFLGVEFSIVHATNRGAAWGILADWQIYLLYLRIVVIFGLFVYALFFNRRKSWTMPLAFIIGGAAGNAADYFLYGHVVDMFYFVLWGYQYPVFNLADTAIFIGIAWLAILSFFEKSPYGKEAT